MAWSAIVAAALAGLLGGVHCLAMCGGFVAALSSRATTAPLRSASALAWAQVPYNLGRISTYTALGAIAGGVGGVLMGATHLLPVQRGLYVVANIALLALAWLVATRREGLAWVQAAGGRAFARVAPALGPLSQRTGPSSQYALGTLWGLVPCGMTYSILTVALFAGDALQGALVMLAFGVGTLPNLLAAGWILGRARRYLERPALRWVAALVLVAFAALGIWRAIADPAGLAQGPFCIVR